MPALFGCSSSKSMPSVKVSAPWIAFCRGNFLPVHDIAFYIAAQIADDTVFVYGFDLMEIDDRVFRKYGAVPFGFDDDFFNVGRKAIGAVVRGGRCNDHCVCKVVKNNGWVWEG